MSCAGSAGGSRPPHQDPSRIPGQCEEDAILEALPNRKKRGQRGTAKGHATEKAKKKLGVDKLPLVWNPQFPEIGNDVGAHHSKFSSALGKAVRSHTSPYFHGWEDIDEDKKDIIWEEMRANFRPLYDHHRHAVLEAAGELYRKWKGRLNAHIKHHVKVHGNIVPCPPEKTVPLQEEWQEYLHFFNSEKLQAKSEVNSINRSQGNPQGTHGRKPVYYRRLEGLPPDATSIGENVVERDPIDSWADTQRDKDGMWVTKEAEANHRLLEHYRTKIAPGERRMLTYEEEKQIFSLVFASRRDSYIGRGPRLAKSRASQMSNASSSTATSSSRHVEIEQMKKKLMIQTSLMDFLLKDYNERHQTHLSFPADGDDQGDNGTNDDDNDLGSQP